MKRFLRSAAALVLCALPLMALNVPQDQNFSGAINFDKGCLWSIQGTKVTATATQLNSAGAKASLATTNVTVQTVTVSNVTGVASATFTPTLVTNSIVYLNSSTNLVTNTFTYVSAGTIAVTLTASPVSVATNVVNQR